MDSGHHHVSSRLSAVPVLRKFGTLHIILLNDHVEMFPICCLQGGRGSGRYSNNSGNDYYGNNNSSWNNTPEEDIGIEDPIIGETTIEVGSPMYTDSKCTGHLMLCFSNSL